MMKMTEAVVPVVDIAVAIVEVAVMAVVAVCARDGCY